MQVRTDLNLQISTENSLMSPGTYMGGSSEMLSPSVTAQQPITPADGKNLVHFEFPPDLVAPSGYHQQPQSQQHQIIASTRPFINPNAVPMEANSNNENQAPMITPVHSQLYPSLRTPQNNQMTVLPRQTFSQRRSNKADIHTLGTGSTMVSAEETSASSMSLDIAPFADLTSSLNNPATNGLHPKRGKYKQKRKQARVVATAGGMVVGGLTLGPAGIVVGAGVGMATNQYYKHKDKKAQRKHEQSCFQQAANESIVARHHGAFC